MRLLVVTLGNGISYGLAQSDPIKERPLYRYRLATIQASSGSRVLGSTRVTVLIYSVHRTLTRKREIFKNSTFQNWV